MKLHPGFALLTFLVSSLVAQTPAPAIGGGSLRNLATLHEGVKRQRISSYDRTGGNNDRLENIAPGKKATLADIKGAGTITHLWVTIASAERYHLRRIVLRADLLGGD